MNIGIIGCGWLGTKIAKHLLTKATIYTTCKTTEKYEILTTKGLNPYQVNFNQNNLIFDNNWISKNKIDIILVCIPFSERFTNRMILKKRFENIKKFIGDFSGQFIYTSSTGVYPNTKKIHKEQDLSPNEVFTENLFRMTYQQTTILRLGGLMGADRLLKKYKVNNLEDVVNHIHYTDVCNIIKKLITQETTNEVFNITAPIHPSKQEIIACQNGLNIKSKLTKKQRIISSDKIQKFIKYEFKYPDPRWFHLQIK